MPAKVYEKEGTKEYAVKTFDTAKEARAWVRMRRYEHINTARKYGSPLSMRYVYKYAAQKWRVEETVG